MSYRCELCNDSAVGAQSHAMLALREPDNYKTLMEESDQCPDVIDKIVETALPKVNEPEWFALVDMAIKHVKLAHRTMRMITDKLVPLMQREQAELDKRTKRLDGYNKLRTDANVILNMESIGWSLMLLLERWDLPKDVADGFYPIIHPHARATLAQSGSAPADLRSLARREVSARELAIWFKDSFTQNYFKSLHYRESVPKHVQKLVS